MLSSHQTAVLSNFLTNYETERRLKISNPTLAFTQIRKWASKLIFSQLPTKILILLEVDSELDLAGSGRSRYTSDSLVVSHPSMKALCLVFTIITHGML